MRKKHIGILCLILAFTGGLGGPPAIGGEEGSPWTDQEWLSRHFSEACRAVEAECRRRFSQYPRLELADPEVVSTLQKGQHPFYNSMVDPLANDRHAVLSAYDHATRTALIAGDRIDRLGRDFPALARTDMLRVLLTHIATHALAGSIHEAEPEAA